MLSSFLDINKFMKNNSVDLIMPDAGRLGGITTLLKVFGRTDKKVDGCTLLLNGTALAIS